MDRMSISRQIPAESDNSKSKAYFRQARFASGQLFVGDVVTSLAANTFFNPSLCDLVSTMISADVLLLEVPPRWVGNPYIEYFSNLLWSKDLLAIGILREAREQIR